MSTYRTPDVYIEEISVFPPSVAEVETAIPAFIGYTQTAINQAANDLLLVPTKIFSFPEYVQSFGLPPGDPIAITVTDDPNNPGTLDSTAVTPVAPHNTPSYLMYYSVKMFFDNGGGQCYIVSVGNYSTPVAAGGTPANVGLLEGLSALTLEDEPTMIVVPDAVKLAAPGYQTVVQAVLAQCQTLASRFAIFDLYDGGKSTTASLEPTILTADRGYYGNNANLMYGAAYYPFLQSAFNYYVAPAEDNVTVSYKTTTAGATPNAITYTGTLKAFGSPVVATLGTDSTAVATDATTVATEATKLATDAAKLATDAGAAPATLAADIAALAADAGTLAADATKLAADATKLAADAGTLPDAATLAADAATLATDATTLAADTAKLATDAAAAPPASAATLAADAAKVATDAAKVAADAATLQTDNSKLKLEFNLAVYNFVKQTLQGYYLTMPPSGAIAGVYAATDTTRGVWKAPANVSLADVNAPLVKIDNAHQDHLNVDTNGGKSINAIRSFAGKGTLVWGARTLAGNDNQWRYVSVRRFFIMVEQSIKNSIYWAVFEPNDANTWVKVRGMIENYLTQKWREGALVGALPTDAFFVRCSLGTTMTADDILNGYMNVEIGMAVARPAEFIVLKFMQKMQTS